jgi:hypothetical protein
MLASEADDCSIQDVQLQAPAGGQVIIHRAPHRWFHAAEKVHGLIHTALRQVHTARPRQFLPWANVSGR